MTGKITVRYDEDEIERDLKTHQVCDYLCLHLKIAFMKIYAYFYCINLNELIAIVIFPSDKREAP